MKIGVVGIGTVGYPLFKALEYYHGEDKVFCYDPHTSKPTYNWERILRCDVVFICVPTDKGKDGRLKMNVVDEVLDKLDDSKFRELVVIKSTLGLGYINEAIGKHIFNIVVFPEWLRENYAFQDTVNPDLTVVGTNKPELVDVVLEACPWHKYVKEEKSIHQVKPEEAIMIKLTANALASTKISFANQVMLVCEKYDLNPVNVMDVIRQDPRCAGRYLNPTRGAYGGYCLPKDTSELAYSMSEDNLFKAVEKVNKVMEKRK